MDEYNGYNVMPQQPLPPQQPAPKKKAPFWLGLLIGIIIGLVCLFICIMVFLTGSIGRRGQNISRGGYYDKIDTLLSYLNSYYLWDLDDETIETALAKGLMDGIGDKYAEYYTPEEFEDLMEGMTGEYAGIGVSITMNDNNEVEVYKVFKGSPAEEAGIHPKDIIIEAAGITDFTDLDAVVAEVRGEPGTTVDIKVRRDGELISMTVERRQISMETVEYRMLDNHIGYIMISEFDSVTVGQFNQAIDDLTAQGMTSVVMDLRDNPGGSLDAVVAMCDRVLPAGVIVSTEDKQGGIQTENSDDANQLNIPIALLINGNSASASEVFVGAIQDYGKGVVVGEQSFGKGIVQSIFQLSDGSGLKFTTENYYTPSGRSIQDVGITPDIQVSIPDEAYEDGVVSEEEDTQLQAAINALLGK
ncbi:MAG: S41 family peptidase [Lachnospiraceae bacterium]|nr:S41 family peptidase [Lachnospiraceae bacterium]